MGESQQMKMLELRDAAKAIKQDIRPPKTIQQLRRLRAFNLALRGTDETVSDK